MKHTLKNLEESKIELTIEVEAEVVEKARKKALKSITQHVTIPGFRKGHAPENLVIQQVGEQSIMNETIDEVIQESYGKTIMENNIRVVSRPENVELITFEPFVYKITVSIYPEVKLEDYKKIKIPAEKAEVSKKDIEEKIEALRARYPKFTEKEEAAQKGDRVTIDFEGKDETGVVLEGTVSKNHPLILGDGHFVPGFEEQLIGVKKDEEKDVTVTFPEDYHAENMRNKKVIFHVKVHKIESRELPVLDEAFFEKMKRKKMDKAEFEKSIEEEILKSKKKENAQKREEKLFEELIKHAKIEVPHSMIHEEMEIMEDEFSRRLQYQGMNLDQYLQFSNKKKEDLHNEWHKTAEDRVRLRLVIAEILKIENIQALPHDIEKEIEKILKWYPEKEQAKVKDQYKEGSEGYQNLLQRIRVSKLMEMFLGKEEETEDAIEE